MIGKGKRNDNSGYKKATIIVEVKLQPMDLVIDHTTSK